MERKAKTSKDKSLPYILDVSISYTTPLGTMEFVAHGRDKDVHERLSKFLEQLKQ